MKNVFGFCRPIPQKKSNALVCGLLYDGLATGVTANIHVPKVQGIRANVRGIAHAIGKAGNGWNVNGAAIIIGKFNRFPASTMVE
jgi:hypothetical protein